MLTVTTRQLHEKGSQGTFVAHVLRVEAVDKPQKNRYFAGISYANGRALGMVSAHRGKRLYTWSRLVAVEEFLMVMGNNLTAMMVYPVECNSKLSLELMVKQYQLDQPVSEAALEQERQTLLATLQLERSSDGTSSNTADPG